MNSVAKKSKMTKDEKLALKIFAENLDAVEAQKAVCRAALAKYHQDMKPIYEARAREDAEFNSRRWRLENDVERVETTKKRIREAIDHAEESAYEHRIGHYSVARVHQSIDCANNWIKSVLNPQTHE